MVMPRLAHISDIHFGKTFNVPVWNNAKQRIKEFNPTIIIASGDFTDSPDLLLLLAAKFELEDLCNGFEPKAEFFIVPGNHDVLDFGNVWHPGAAWLFERVMFSDTTQIRANLESSMGDKVGLNEKTLLWSGFPRTNRLNPHNWIWRSLGTKCDGRLQSCDYRRGGSQWPSKSIHDQALIACFNSNASSVRQFVFATGNVEGDQITRIGSEIPHAECPCCKSRGSARSPPPAESAILLRVAVLHHHPLPIAIRRSLVNQGTEARLEPFLILKNGADLIHELQRQRYDLVLHGHKHRPQFASVELRADDLEGYPLLVLAGGSTAHRDEDPPCNTLRDIGTEPNGRLTARTFEQGELQKDRIYREPLPVLKRRAFVGAIERAKISAEELFSKVIIEGVGHLRSLDRTSGLRVRKEGHTLDGMVINVTLSPDGQRLPLHLEDDCRSKVTLAWEDSTGKSYKLDEPVVPRDAYCWLGMMQPLQSGSQPLTFGVEEAATNSIAMSRWEVDERHRHKKHASGPPSYKEAIGFNITYPVERILLHLEFPVDLDGITPEVRCYRHPAAPNFPLRFRREERPLKEGPDPDYLEDDELAKEEAKRLRYEAKDRRWILEIDRPIAGNRYTLQWSVPDLEASKKAGWFTQDYQKLLLTLGQAPDPSEPPDIRKRCDDLFKKLADELMTRFRSKNRNERQTAFLMVYDREKLRLRPVLTHISKGSLPPGSYELPLGEGVAGAAFLGRQILAWVNDPKSGSLIKPQPDNLNSQWVLALPIFYQEEKQGKDGAAGELKLETRPGALIGVVTLGSDNISSLISECYGEDEAAKKKGQVAQLVAQSSVFEILNVLSRSPASSSKP
jgi:3',5'-cyclic AMP phosphodiesterase CpdA